MTIPAYPADGTPADRARRFRMLRSFRDGWITIRINIRASGNGKVQASAEEAEEKQSEGARAMTNTAAAPEDRYEYRKRDDGWYVYDRVLRKEASAYGLTWAAVYELKDKLTRENQNLWENRWPLPAAEPAASSYDRLACDHAAGT